MLLSLRTCSRSSEHEHDARLLVGAAGAGAGCLRRRCVSRSGRRRGLASAARLASLASGDEASAAQALTHGATQAGQSGPRQHSEALQRPSQARVCGLTLRMRRVPARPLRTAQCRLQANTGSGAEQRGERRAALLAPSGPSGCSSAAPARAVCCAVLCSYPSSTPCCVLTWWMADCRGEIDEE